MFLFMLNELVERRMARSHARCLMMTRKLAHQYLPIASLHEAKNRNTAALNSSLSVAMPSGRERALARLRWQQETEAFASFVIPADAATMGDRDRVVAESLKKHLFPVPLYVQPQASPLKRTLKRALSEPTSEHWARLLPSGGGVIQHTRRCSTRDSPDEVLGEHLMTHGEHRFIFTVLRGTGTGMRVGVASADGSKTVGIRLYDGRVVHHPATSAEHGSPRWLRAHAPMGDGDTRRKWALPIALGGTELPPQLTREDEPRAKMLWDRLPGAVQIETVVNLVARKLTFTVGATTIEAAVELPEGGVRLWFESRTEHDAIAVSEYRAGPAPAASKVRSVSPRPLSVAAAKRRQGKFEQDQEAFTRKMQAVREAGAGALSPGPGAYNAMEAFRSKMGKGILWSIGPSEPEDSRSTNVAQLSARSLNKQKGGIAPPPRRRGSFKLDTSAWADRDNSAGNSGVVKDLSELLRVPGSPRNSVRPHSAHAEYGSGGRKRHPKETEEARLLDALADIRAIARRVQGIHWTPKASASSSDLRVHAARRTTCRTTAYV